MGQGAFGEVYEGHYRKCSTDSGETAVAVKTLTELSTNQGNNFYSLKISISLLLSLFLPFAGGEAKGLKNDNIVYIFENSPWKRYNFVLKFRIFTAVRIR